jgi:hypothetical protein
MTTPGRSNGLRAEAWTPLTTVDPRLVSELLSALAEAGIAARSEPARGTRGPYLEVKLPAAPVEEIYVDAAQVAPARVVLDRVTGKDTDDAFHQIVAGWGDPLPEVDWPGAAPTVSAPPAATGWRSAERTLDPDNINEALDSVVADDEEHYEAPSPPPVPRISWQAALSWFALLGGLALLIWSISTDSTDELWRFVGVVGIIGGIVGLVLRLHARV